MPFSILGFGTLTLDPFREDFAAAGGYRWYVVARGGHLVSFYPIGTSLAALPFYAPFYFFLRATGRADHASLFHNSAQAEKLAASVMAALSVALFSMIVRRFVTPRTALWSSVAFGLGTSVWATASQALWQHGAIVLSLTLALLFLTWPGRPNWSAACAGFALALGLVARPSASVLYAAGIGCELLRQDSMRNRLVHVALFVAGGAPLFVFDAIFGGNSYNSSLGGYTSLQIGYFVPAKFLEGLVGVLFSPNRGLFVFSPLALLGFYGLLRGALRFPQERNRVLPFFGLAVAAHLLAVASYREWGGGWAFGPRYLVDILPVLGLAAAKVWDRFGPAWKRATGVALVWSILVQLNGSFCYPASQWDARFSGNIEGKAWDFSHFELWEDFQAWSKLKRVSTP